MSRKRHQNRSAVSDEGDPCPRCGRPMQVREHVAITVKELARPHYYARWFYCTHADCKTKQVMPDRFKVFTEVGKRQEAERDRLMDREAEIATAAEDIVMQVARDVGRSGPTVGVAR